MLDPTHIVQSGGLILIGFILFAEVGLFLGFFLPGDTLLIIAGVFAHQNKMSLPLVIIVAAISAIAGDNTAYFIGKKYGRGLFKKKDSLMFRADHLKKAEDFYSRHGVKAVSVAHFLPVVRTFTPLVAGIAKMPHRAFFMYDAVGDIVWAISITLVGYFVGSKIPNIDHYILAVIALVVFVSLSPTLYQLGKRFYLKFKK